MSQIINQSINQSINFHRENTYIQPILVCHISNETKQIADQIYDLLSLSMPFELLSNEFTVKLLFVHTVFVHA